MQRSLHTSTMLRLASALILLQEIYKQNAKRKAILLRWFPLRSVRRPMDLKAICPDKVVDAAKEAGATGATILSGRGTGCHEAKTFFGLTLEPQSDIILMLIEEHLVQGILDAIVEAGEFDKPGTGMAFVLPVEQVVGLDSQLSIIKEKIQDQYF